MILNGECGTFSPLMLECLLDIKDAICEELNTISEEKQTSIQIEKLKKNLKSGGGGGELIFLNSDEKLSTEDARENRYHADSKDDLK